MKPQTANAGSGEIVSRVTAEPTTDPAADRKHQQIPPIFQQKRDRRRRITRDGNCTLPDTAPSKPKKENSQ
jgi:hypothetical protein